MSWPKRIKTDNIEIKRLYVDEDLSARAISQILGISDKTVLRRLEDMNIKKRTMREVAINTARRGLMYMQSEVGRASHSRKMKGKSYNRKLKYNRKYFKNWTPNMAYLLGLIYADGCIHGTIWTVSSKDKQLIDLIVNEVGEATTSLKKPGSVWAVVYSSTEMTSDLRNIGLVERKARVMRFPDVPHDLLPHFIRGYFDGDGCIFYHKTNKTWGLCFTSASLSFLESLHKKLPIKGGCLRARTNNAYELRFGEGDTMLVCRYIYIDEEFCLHRKRNLYRKMLLGVIK